MNRDDTNVLLRVRDGYVDEYAHIIRAYEPRILRYVQGRLYDKEQSFDIVQNVFIKFYSALARFDVTKPVLPYLYAIAINELKMYFRTRPKNQVSLKQEDFQNLAVEDVSAEDPELSQALQLLTPDQRSAILMYADGYKYQEIAQMLKKPINTVRTLIHRARASLRTRL
jgi:RNA polymerase sigma-70 factor (ECF subfamily)